jgi:oligoendopeptidase F
MFAEFEKNIHEIEERGEALTLEVFKSTYHALLEAYFGQSVVLDPQLDLECLRIPHFYSAFYVYKYATGISAAVALSQRALAKTPGSVEAYLDFLKSGGSKFPLETLKAAGIDMATSAPIERTLELFAQRLEELEGLLLH